MPRLLPTACIQTCPCPDFVSAIDEMTPLVGEALASGARFIALPEYCGGLRSDGPMLVPPSAPETSHPVLSAVSEMARKGKVWILLGSIAVDGPGGRMFNRGFLIDDTGVPVARYDKLHMFDIQLSKDRVYRESAVIAPGSKAVVAEAPFARVGMTICYDLRFPGLYRDLAKAGAEILTVPAAFVAATGKAHWHVLNRARAIENGCFVVSPCATGPVPGGGETYGHSLIIDPWGTELADAGEGPGVAIAELDLDMVGTTRDRIPSLSHDRHYEFSAMSKVKVA